MPNADPAKDTIAAVATPAGRGGIGVIRVSGALAPDIARGVLGMLPAPRHATLAKFRDARGEVVDEGVALCFRGPHSYTGEDVFEFQGHGGPVVVAATLAACIDRGARLAQPGEFTRRAFLNGKIDLAQAEAVADLIEASTREAAKSALRSLSGEFSDAVGILVEQLTELRALTEAVLDFPEEEVDSFHRDDARARLARVREALDGVLQRSRQGSLLRTGIDVVLAGRPNVGKSSLLNRLAGEDRAIVTPVPGTTRDILRETISIDGVPLNIVDTAGLREGADEVERLGIARARAAVESADLVLLLVDASAGMTAQDLAIANSLPPDLPRLQVYNKIDLVQLRPGRTDGDIEAVFLSARTGEGLDGLRDAILRKAGWRDSGESPFIARERHLRALSLAGERLKSAAEHDQRWELFAEELRLAQNALASIAGEFTPDDLLGEIFSRFCIGK